MPDVTRLLAADLLPLVYEELRKLAAARLAQEKPGQTLQATAPVHEAYLRLVGGAVNGQVGTDSGTGTGPVVVNAGGTLGGTGRAAGAVTLRGRLQGGDGATATGSPALTTAAVTFEGGSRLRVAVGSPSPGTAVHSRVLAAALNRSSASDVLTVELFDTGALDLSGTKTYAVTVVEYGTSNATAANVNVTAVNFSFVGAPIVNQTGAALVVLFTPVPEPAAVLGLAAGLGLVGTARRRAAQATPRSSTCASSTAS